MQDCSLNGIAYIQKAPHSLFCPNLPYVRIYPSLLYYITFCCIYQRPELKWAPIINIPRSRVVWAGKSSCDDHLEAVRLKGQNHAGGGHLLEIKLSLGPEAKAGNACYKIVCACYKFHPKEAKNRMFWHIGLSLTARVHRY